MKKIILILVALFGFGFAASAQSGSCKIPNTNDYVQVTYNTAPATNRDVSTSKFVIANSSIFPLVSARVQIRAEITTCFGQPSCEEYQKVILYDDFVYDIAPFKSVSVEFQLRKYVKIKNIEVIVANPSCKYEKE